MATRGRPVEVAAEVHRTRRRKVASPSGARVRRAGSPNGDPVRSVRAGESRLRAAHPPQGHRARFHARADRRVGQVVELRKSAARGGRTSLGSTGSALGIPTGPSRRAEVPRAADRRRSRSSAHEPAPPRELLAFDIGRRRPGRIGGDDEPGTSCSCRSPTTSSDQPADAGDVSQCQSHSAPEAAGRRRPRAGGAGRSGCCSSWSTSAATCASSTR